MVRNGKRCHAGLQLDPARPAKPTAKRAHGFGEFSCLLLPVGADYVRLRMAWSNQCATNV